MKILTTWSVFYPYSVRLISRTCEKGWETSFVIPNLHPPAAACPSLGDNGILKIGEIERVFIKYT